MPRKHIPQRTCVGCRQVKDKRELVRVIRSSAGAVEVDESGKQPGRGAYLCRDLACWEAATKERQLDRALRVRLTQEEMARLREYAKTMPMAGDGED